MICYKISVKPTEKKLGAHHLIKNEKFKIQKVFRLKVRLKLNRTDPDNLPELERKLKILFAR